MAEQQGNPKRTFEMMRDLWEHRAASAAVLPSPSPSKKFAKSPLNAAGRNTTTTTSVTVTTETIVERHDVDEDIGSSPSTNINGGNGNINGIGSYQSAAAAVAFKNGQQPNQIEITPYISSPTIHRVSSSPEQSAHLHQLKRTFFENPTKSIEDQVQPEPDIDASSYGEDDEDEEHMRRLLQQDILSDDESVKDPAEEEDKSFDLESIKTHHQHNMTGDSLFSPVMKSPNPDDYSSMAVKSFVLSSPEEDDAGMTASPPSEVSQPVHVENDDTANEATGSISRTASIVSVKQPTTTASTSNRLQRDSTVSVPIPGLIFDEAESEGPVDNGTAIKVADDNVIMGLQKEIAALEAEADRQQTVVTQVRRTVNISEKASVRRSSSSAAMVQPRAEAERTVLIAARKRKGCLAQAQQLRTSLADYKLQSLQKRSDLYTPFHSDDYNARLTIRRIDLTINPEFVQELKHDTSADFFVVIVFMLYEQVYATEVLQLDEFHISSGTLAIHNLIQFQQVQYNFHIEVEANLIRISRGGSVDGDSKHSSGHHSHGSHTPAFIKRLMAALPKSGSKDHSHNGASSSSASFRSGNTDHANVMSLGSTKLTLDNYLQKRHVLTEGLLVQQYEVILNTDVNLDLDVTVPHSGFLTFHCYNDMGTDWMRRYCVLNGSTLCFWKYPDDVNKNISPLCRFDLQHCIIPSVQKISADDCARANSFLLTSDRPIFTSRTQLQQQTGEDGQEDKFDYYVSADNRNSMLAWMDHINTVLGVMHAWRLDKK